MRIIIPIVLLVSIIVVLSQTSARPNSSSLIDRVAQLEAQVEELTVALEEAQEILSFVHVEEGEMSGLVGPHWVIEGANVHVRSGSGSTPDGCGPAAPGFPNCESLTGLGNLIVGYNDQRPSRLRAALPREVRTGSHNLVVGDFHSYSSFAGFVAGSSNQVIGPNASVSGGHGNSASGASSAVSGGFRNEASGSTSSVSGGENRTAANEFNWAAGSLLEVN